MLLKVLVDVWVGSKELVRNRDEGRDRREVQRWGLGRGTRVPERKPLKGFPRALKSDIT